MTDIKISVIIPIYNTEKYLRECLDSVVNQTLKDIEIICVNDGSNDTSPEILAEYALQDSRIKVINKSNSGYGHTMNVGIDAAIGEYIGIVESDDYIKLDMYETLYNIAHDNCLDFIKADFYRFVNENNELKLEYNKLSENDIFYNKILNPQSNIKLFNLILNTWSGIYSRDFLNKNNIRHNETPGASYQDNGFWFKTFALAGRVYFLNKPFYMNRRDNPNSSVHSKAKVYCMNQEYEYILDFLNKNPGLKEKLFPMFLYKKYQNYMFTYNRIGEEFKLGYIVRFSEEFKESLDSGLLQEDLFGKKSWENLLYIINDPLTYYLRSISQTKYLVDNIGNLEVAKIKILQLQAEINQIQNSFSFKIGRIITFMPRKIIGLFKCFKEFGVIYTLNRTFQKIGLKK